MGLESTQLSRSQQTTVYLFCPKINQLIQFQVSLIPIFLISQPHTTSSLYDSPHQIISLPRHEPAGDSRRRIPAAKERGSAPGASPAASQSQERISQDQEAAAAPRRPTSLGAGAEPAPTETGGNLLRLPQSHPRQPR